MELEGYAKIHIKCPKCKEIVLINTIKKSNDRLPN